MSARVLVVEDEAGIRLALKGLLGREGHEVALASSGEQAIEMLRSGDFDLVLTDLALGRGASGMDVLAAARELRPDAPVVMITAHGSEKIAVEAMKAGAEDYLPKPFDNDELRVVVRRALDRYRLRRENALLLERIEREYGFANLIGSGPAMRAVFETIKKVAQTDLSVLVQGESGTGKELVAQALHDASHRRRKPFVAVNCAAMNRELVESELFGHEKGAFTGADSRRIGRFEAAEGGTIFLDEIGDMAPETQAKVLRVVEQREVERVGSTRALAIDVRIVSATHRDLEREVAAGRFREDLFYRLKVVSIGLPPLRERGEDIPALAQRFLGQLATRLGREQRALSAAALSRLVRHPWPGNVRELRNVLEQAAVLAPGEAIEESDLGLASLPQPPAPPGAAAGVASCASAEAHFAEAKKRAVEAFERDYLLAALRRHGGNVSRTAEAIGMVRQSLQQKIRDLELRSYRWDAPAARGLQSRGGSE